MAKHGPERDEITVIIPSIAFWSSASLPFLATSHLS